MKTKPLWPEERKALEGLKRSINLFRSAMGPDVSASAIQAVLEVVLAEGITLAEWQRELAGEASPMKHLLDHLSSPPKRGHVRELLIRTEDTEKGGTVLSLSPRARLFRRTLCDTLIAP